MSERIEQLHTQISAMSLSDVMRLASQAIDAGLDDQRIEIILKYVEIKLADRKIARLRR